MSKESKVLFIPSKPSLSTKDMELFRELWVKSMMEVSGIPGKLLNSPEDMKYVMGVDLAEPGGDVTVYQKLDSDKIKKVRWL